MNKNIWLKIIAGVVTLSGLAFFNCSRVGLSSKNYQVGSTAISGFNWVLIPGVCSAQCGPGQQLPTAVCEDDAHNIAPDNFCAGTKPVATHTNCNIQNCSNAYMWVVTPNGTCTPTIGVCGAGTQPETVTCVDANAKPVNDLLCAESSPRPLDIVACQVPCPPGMPNPNPTPTPGPSTPNPTPTPGPSTPNPTPNPTPGPTTPNPTPNPAPMPVPPQPTPTPPPAPVPPTPTPAPAPVPPTPPPPPMSGVGCHPGTYARCIVNVQASSPWAGWGVCDNGYPGECYAACHGIWIPAQQAFQDQWYIQSNCGGLDYFYGLIP